MRLIIIICSLAISINSIGQNTEPSIKIGVVSSHGLSHRNFSKKGKYTYDVGINLSKLVHEKNRVGISILFSSLQGGLICNNYDIQTGVNLCEVRKYEMIRSIKTPIFFEKKIPINSNKRISMFNYFAVSPNYIIKTLSVLNQYIPNYRYFNMNLQTGVSSYVSLKSKYLFLIRLHIESTLIDIRKGGSWDNRIVYGISTAINI
jgi:hypothetical protein